MVEIKINNEVYTVPNAWHELSPGELLFLVSLTGEAGKTTAEVQLKFLLHCLKAKVLSAVTYEYYIIQINRRKYTLEVEELTALSTIYDFLFTEDAEGRPQLTPQMMPNPLQKIRVRGTTLHGPSQGLDNLTYDEFVWLQTYMSQLDSNPDVINHLVNALYTTKTGKRQPKLVRAIPTNYKSLITLFILGSLSFLQSKFPAVFAGGKGGDITNVFDYQQRIIDSLADGDVTRKDQVRQSLLYDALYSMEMAALRQEAMDKQMKKQK